MARPHGRAIVDARHPEAHAICDRCGTRYLHRQLRWDFQWAGPRLQNRRYLVCDDCYDKPQEQLRLIVLPPDPQPISNPRPENFIAANNGGKYIPSIVSGLNSAGIAAGGIAGLGQDPATLYPQGLNYGSPIGNLTLGGGLNSAFNGSITKPFWQCASLANSNSSYNSVGVNWNAIPGYPASITSTSSVAGTQSFAIQGFTITGPNDRAICNTSGSSFHFQGSNDGANWTDIYIGTTLGIKYEQITITSSQILSIAQFSYHRLAVVGDGLTPVGIAQLQMAALGPSLANLWAPG